MLTFDNNKTESTRVQIPHLPFPSLPSPSSLLTLLNPRQAYNKQGRRWCDTTKSKKMIVRVCKQDKQINHLHLTTSRERHYLHNTLKLD